MKKRKDDREYTKKDFFHLKRKLLSAFAMFLVATILMTSTSYAWLVLSVAPEVTGITTNIGANGSLEMALLTTETRADLSTIRTTVGESLAQRNPSANNTWGNLVDLSYSDYGLNEIMLMPSRLNIVPGADGYSVDTNLISVPTYGYDGRIVELNDETMSATYNENVFSLVVGSQDYGVRAIGTANTLSVQASALALAKANIKTYLNNAKSSTNSILNSYGDDLFDIILTYTTNGTYYDSELNTLKLMIASIDGVADYIDRAIRQGFVAVAASEISDKATFTAVRDRVMDTSKELSTIMEELEEIGEIPAEFINWVNEFSELQNDINAANNAANALSGGSYTWDQFRNILDYIMNINYVYINDTIFPNFDKSSATGLIGSTIKLDLGPNSGVFVDIANFIGNYNYAKEYFKNTIIDIHTVSNVNPAYLDALDEAIKDLGAADGGEGAEAVALTATYGYAIDLAFRCNAAVSNLLLQTTPEHRVYDGTETGSAMGGGSYMEFSTKDNSFGVDKTIELMDAVRVTFIDDKNNILGIAKLNTSNREITAEGVKASLYLYDFSLSEEDNSILMGERRKTENTITSLDQNVAKAITAVVWLDGDIVDNTMVSATESASLNGVLNLQFSSSANLIPASNSELLNVTADKGQLEEALGEYTAADGEITLGQRNYTTVSWEAFVEAYNYAVAVNNNPNANDSQVYFAALALAEAEANLEVISTDAVETKISEVRELMGTSPSDKAEPKEYFDENGEVYYEANQVDYNKNPHDEGNEIFTQIYTDESWQNLANALYDAEATVSKPIDKLTDAELNAVLTELTDAEEKLQRRVFYTPYEYNGKIYYEAICDASNADTYGKWYDSNFKRVVADLTILNLDAYAVPADVFEVVQDHVPNTTTTITPYVDVLDDFYPSLRNEVIKAAKWSVFDVAYFDDTRTEPEAKEPQYGEIFELVYENESAGVTLNLTGKEGEARIEILVLTENGIVNKIIKEFTIYTPAEGINVDLDTDELKIGENANAETSLYYSGNPEYKENIKKITWASENTNVATVSGNTISAKGEGIAVITVTIETEQGNVYTDYVTVNVSK